MFIIVDLPLGRIARSGKRGGNLADTRRRWRRVDMLTCLRRRLATFGWTITGQRDRGRDNASVIPCAAWRRRLSERVRLLARQAIDQRGELRALLVDLHAQVAHAGVARLVGLDLE